MCFFLPRSTFMILLLSKPKLNLIIFFLLLFWLTGIFFNVLISFFHVLVFLHPFVNKCFSLVCHQDNEKLIRVFNLPLLVCARCSGIYIGLFASSLTNFFITKKIKVSTRSLIISSLPMLCDVISSTSGIYKYSNIAAFITGLFFGTVLFFYFYNVIQEYFAKNLRENN